MKILVEKKNGEPRALCIPAVRDRVVETAALQVVEPVLEKEFEDCSFAYRKGRSVKQVVYKIKDYYDKGYRLTSMPIFSKRIRTSDRIDIRYVLNHEEHEVHEEWNLINYQIELLDAR